jgi:hypothetical protein
VLPLLAAPLTLFDMLTGEVGRQGDRTDPKNSAGYQVGAQRITPQVRRRFRKPYWWSATIPAPIQSN